VNHKIEGKIIDNSLELLDDLFIDEPTDSDTDSDESVKCLVKHPRKKLYYKK
jgi:hypothetical protein